MMNVFAGKQEDVDLWIRACKEEVSSCPTNFRLWTLFKSHKEMTSNTFMQIPPEDWRKFFSDRNYVCGVDFPFSMHYKQLMKAYPDAKVVTN